MSDERKRELAEQVLLRLISPDEFRWNVGQTNRANLQRIRQRAAHAASIACLVAEVMDDVADSMTASVAAPNDQPTKYQDLP